MRNIGKIFEDNFKECVPHYAKPHRLPDDAQSFGGGKKSRFSKKNPFDFFVWNFRDRLLYCLELKSVAGKSISFERTKDEKPKKEIHYHQIVGLNEWDECDYTICGFVIEFRGIEKTVFIDIKEFNKIIDNIPKKSFNYDDLSIYDIKYTIIEQEKKRKYYRYDVDGFFNIIKKLVLSK